MNKGCCNSGTHYLGDFLPPVLLSFKSPLSKILPSSAAIILALLKFLLGTKISPDSHFWSHSKPSINWKISIRLKEEGVISCDLVSG